MNNIDFWQQVRKTLKEKKAGILLTVVQSSGSSPGQTGFKMFVTEDLSLGTVGGGISEYQLQKECREILKRGEEKAFIRELVHREDSDKSSGLICSGEQTVAVISLNLNHLACLNELCDITVPNLELRLSQKGFTTQKVEASPEKNSSRHLFFMKNDKEWFFTEKNGYAKSVYIVGAGHVGLALSKLLQELDFYVTIFDNRQDFEMFESNSYADRKYCIDFDQINDYIPESMDSFVVIMTAGHSEDKKVLQLLLNKKYGYVGLMGSRVKIAALMDDLVMDDDFKERFYAPIGLNIRSKTAAEIAISIAAQLILKRNLISNV